MTPERGRTAEGDASQNGRVGERAFTAIALSYVHLWVLEGAVRKWVPGTEQFMYVARDVLLVAAVVVLLIVVHRDGKRRVVWFWALALVLVFWGLFQVMLGLVPLAVAVVGLRSYLAPALLVAAAWALAPRSLAASMRQTLVAYAAPMLLLVAVQVTSPALSAVNREVASDAAYFVNFGVVRASGTFSSPAGLTSFIPICLAMSLALLSERGSRRQGALALIGIISSVALAAVSGSRGAVLAVAIVLALAAVRGIVRGSFRELAQAILVILVIAATWLMVSSFLPDVLASFARRFDDASRSENSIARLGDQAFSFFAQEVSMLGGGAGGHSQAGIGLGSGLEWVEWDSERWVAELGVLGLLLALGRILAAFLLVVWMIATARSSGSTAYFAASVLVPILAYGTITQSPSYQGAFGIVATLFVLTVTRPMEPSDVQDVAERQLTERQA